jgi:hypothetical protein
MARPNPNILLQDVDDTDQAYEVCAADSIYAVCYQGRPIQVRKRNLQFSYPGKKYIKTTFPNPGHAFNLAERLNLRFDTDLFTVAIMSIGRFIEE